MKRLGIAIVTAFEIVFCMLMCMALLFEYRENARDFAISFLMLDSLRRSIDERKCETEDEEEIIKKYEAE